MRLRIGIGMARMSTLCHKRSSLASYSIYVNALALRRKPVDRLPVFMWFHPQTAKRLPQLLEIPVSHVAEAMGDDIGQN